MTPYRSVPEPGASLLDRVVIAAPCDEPWEGMKGDDRVRHCARCRKDVYDVSAMTRDEAEALLRGADGRLCVQLFRRRDGTVLTKDCPVGVQERSRRRVTLALFGAGAAAAYFVTYQTPQPRPPHPLSRSGASEQEAGLKGQVRGGAVSLPLVQARWRVPTSAVTDLLPPHLRPPEPPPPSTPEVTPLVGIAGGKTP